MPFITSLVLVRYELYTVGNTERPFEILKNATKTGYLCTLSKRFPLKNFRRALDDKKQKLNLIPQNVPRTQF